MDLTLNNTPIAILIKDVIINFLIINNMLILIFFYLFKQVLILKILIYLNTKTESVISKDYFND